MITVAVLLCGLLAVMGVVGFFVYRRFVNTLRDEHPQTWDTVGRPGLVFYRSLEGQRLIHRFVRDREYETLDDPSFVRFCRFYRAYLRTYTWTFASTCLVLVLAGLGVGVA